MNEERFVLTDDVWLRLAPHLPGKQGDAGMTGKDNRLFLEAVLWRVPAGLPWRDLPPDFGNWNSVFRRFRRWAENGVFERIFNEALEITVKGVFVYYGPLPNEEVARRISAIIEENL